MKSAILGNEGKGGSAILALAAQHGKDAEKPRKRDEPMKMEPRPKRVTIEKIANGFKVIWSGSDYGRDTEAHASTWGKASKIAKAYMEGEAPEKKESDEKESDDEEKNESSEDEANEEESGEED